MPGIDGPGYVEMDGAQVFIDPPSDAEITERGWVQALVDRNPHLDGSQVRAYLGLRPMRELDIDYLEDLALIFGGEELVPYNEIYNK